MALGAAGDLLNGDAFSKVIGLDLLRLVLVALITGVFIVGAGMAHLAF